ncbi:MAG: TIR domain-containing protein [Bacteroidetes bacterium]|nr:TIR domain-containing protein [Bacteroidota bacterium]MCL5027115.1 TIR domain-containing protein [Chloroflexota bacterium]
MASENTDKGIGSRVLAREYKLFISHAWTQSDDYDRLISLLRAAPNFRWRNLSVPRPDPALGASEKALDLQLRGQVLDSHALLILSGLYEAQPRWVQAAINAGLAMNKPIIGVQPWNGGGIPWRVQSVAYEMVGWDADSLVAAIQRWSL